MNSLQYVGVHCNIRGFRYFVLPKSLFWILYSKYLEMLRCEVPKRSYCPALDFLFLSVSAQTMFWRSNGNWYQDSCHKKPTNLRCLSDKITYIWLSCVAWESDIRTISPMHITKSLRVDSQVGITEKGVVYHVTYDVAVALIFFAEILHAQWCGSW